MCTVYRNIHCQHLSGHLEGPLCQNPTEESNCCFCCQCSRANNGLWGFTVSRFNIEDSHTNVVGFRRRAQSSFTACSVLFIFCPSIKKMWFTGWKYFELSLLRKQAVNTIKSSAQNRWMYELSTPSGDARRQKKGCRCSHGISKQGKYGESQIKAQNVIKQPVKGATLMRKLYLSSHLLFYILPSPLCCVFRADMLLKITNKPYLLVSAATTGTNKRAREKSLLAF